MEKKIFSVTEITSSIKRMLEDTFTDVWIDGEVSNHRFPASGHQYFTVKDENCQIRTVLFKYQQRRISCELKDGMRILLHGKVTVYGPRGEYQIVADYWEPKGAGALQKAYEQLKEKLAKEGLFDEGRKKPIPLFPKKIGIVTSATGAAIQDMLNIIERRFANIHILIFPVKVQGEGAAEEIAMAIEEVNTFSDIDTIIIGRGGGAIEDLWAFNEEIVARKIAASHIPVISAVGHETDFTIADFVADMRASTPSAAAELVIKNKKDIHDKVLFLQRRLGDICQGKCSLLRSRVESLIEKKAYVSPVRRLTEYQQRIDDLLFSMERSVRYHLTSLQHAMGGTVKRLNAVSPLAVLERGFSICTEASSGRLIKNTAGVLKGDTIDIRLSKGKLVCTVEDIL